MSRFIHTVLYDMTDVVYHVIYMLRAFSYSRAAVALGESVHCGTPPPPPRALTSLVSLSPPHTLFQVEDYESELMRGMYDSSANSQV